MLPDWLINQCFTTLRFSSFIYSSNVCRNWWCFCQWFLASSRIMKVGWNWWCCLLWFQAIVKKYQFWRILTSPCVFASTPELVFGLFLIYYFRIFERQIGSNKYTVCLLLILGSCMPCLLKFIDWFLLHPRCFWHSLQFLVRYLI
jgi:membrane associated rhomboid family serine protease